MPAIPPATLRSVTRSLAARALLALALVLNARVSRAQANLPDGFTDTLIYGGLAMPVGMARLPDGRLFVVEQKSAKIRLIVNGALAAVDPVLTVAQVKTSGTEQGLLGIAIDPDWPAKPYVYVHCDDTGGFLRITRYTVGGDLANTGNHALTINASSRRDILTGVPDVELNHNGGTLRFGLDDMLYASFGEDGQGCPAQDTLTLRGVILRLDVSAVPAGGGATPSMASIAAAGNPLINHVDPRSRLIWEWGLRNPFRFQIDPQDGSLYIGDVGEVLLEEIDWAPVGGLDFGWPYYEANLVNDPSCALTGPAVPPIYIFDRGAQGQSAIMCAGVYRLNCTYAPNCGFGAAYDGDLFFSDYYSGEMRRVKGSGNNWSLAPPVPGQPSSTVWATNLTYVSDYLFPPDGSMWYCREGAGQIRRIAGPGTILSVEPGSSMSVGSPYPLPSTGTVFLPFSLAHDAEVKISVFDLRGRRVRALLPRTTFSAGPHQPSWDGRDDAGREVPPGLYLAQVEIAGQTSLHRVLLVR